MALDAAVTETHVVGMRMRTVTTSRETCQKSQSVISAETFARGYFLRLTVVKIRMGSLERRWRDVLKALHLDAALSTSLMFYLFTAKFSS